MMCVNNCCHESDIDHVTLASWHRWPLAMWLPHGLSPQTPRSTPSNLSYRFAAWLTRLDKAGPVPGSASQKALSSAEPPKGTLRMRSPALTPRQQYRVAIRARCLGETACLCDQLLASIAHCAIHRNRMVIHRITYCVCIMCCARRGSSLCHLQQCSLRCWLRLTDLCPRIGHASSKSSYTFCCCRSRMPLVYHCKAAITVGGQWIWIQLFRAQTSTR